MDRRSFIHKAVAGAMLPLASVDNPCAMPVGDKQDGPPLIGTPIWEAKDGKWIDTGKRV